MATLKKMAKRYLPLGDTKKKKMPKVTLKRYGHGLLSTDHRITLEKDGQASSTAGPP